ncbi:helix-turn-helix domain-containing protein [Streptomyces sp. NPDC085596]|uniref:helix-turn-helix domain-containing protein n=1 Tax=Streptomyces sp. NPDC085596 TaxID=3365731 RepID=UPI0037D347FE
MARWKALPDDLDPQIGEFTGQLRRLVDQGGLSVAALADRTGYSKTSWERYLNGRLLAPKGAIVALAEVTGTSPVHLTTMWELAERAWSRAEMRHDRTMEQIRITQARAELGDFGGARAEAEAAGGVRTARAGTGAAGAPPVIPPQPRAGEGDARNAGPSRTVAGEPHEGRRRLLLFLAGAVAVLVVIGGVFLLTGRGDGGEKPDAAKSPSPSATGAADLPPGVKCVGSGCAGKDAEAMGCSGDLVTTAKTATVGAATLEVRYSRTCGAAWGRITGAALGDQVRITAGRTAERGDTAAGDTFAYTPMVAVGGAGEAEACVTLAAGRTGCTK